ncbi:stabilizer of axonemal microtubules 3-like isoform X2 [Hypanus sabinus]|uniref:stabilizer of axonemal microtubules 3-like isoform X2 n=1 Tax=Hypanus sabinus TaxID=79690 RepID=UPI0028C50EAB|nr:stabilizer of axonemal microtubules 3-like isoform X2 [Hypanus sabinus]
MTEGDGAMALPGRRQDLRWTSSGVGLHHCLGRDFPPSDLRSFLKEPLPLKLKELDTNHSCDEVFNYYETTTGLTHNLKTIDGILGHPRHVKVPSHWNVHYMKDLTEKLSRRDWRSPLSMANQTSEMKDKHTGRLPLSMDTAFRAGPQPFSLENHLSNGPSKGGAGGISTEGRCHPLADRRLPEGLGSWAEGESPAQGSPAHHPRPRADDRPSRVHLPDQDPSPAQASAACPEPGLQDPVPRVLPAPQRREADTGCLLPPAGTMGGDSGGVRPRDLVRSPDVQDGEYGVRNQAPCSHLTRPKGIQIFSFTLDMILEFCISP